MAKKLSLSKKTKTVSIDTKRIDSLYARISSYIDDARHNIQRTVDTERELNMVAFYYKRSLSV